HALWPASINDADNITPFRHVQPGLVHELPLPLLFGLFCFVLQLNTISLRVYIITGLRCFNLEKNKIRFVITGNGIYRCTTVPDGLHYHIFSVS
ncbi:hypothetical protein UP36_25095, partial [Salmonella enterica subsp. enterica]|nr:hypothetical protein [Salmonella enterica subsp. enterica]